MVIRLKLGARNIVDLLVLGLLNVVLFTSLFCGLLLLLLLYAEFDLSLIFELGLVVYGLWMFFIFIGVGVIYARLGALSA